MVLKKDNIVVHANCFAAAIDKNLTPVEQRMLAIYLSKLNPNDISTRVVEFTLDEYEAIMGLEKRNLSHLHKCAKKIIQTPVTLSLPSGGFEVCPVFSRFRVDKIDGVWSVLIDCTDSVLPYLFNLKKEFMQYALWNMLNLKETNHQQLYRLLKQYEKVKSKAFTLDDLKLRLGVHEIASYAQYKFFRFHLIEPCKKALAEKTDIQFEYEPIKKGRKVHAIKFTIHKNTPPGKKPLLSEFVAEMANESSIALDQHDNQGCLGNGFQLSAGGQAQTYTDPNVIFFAEACNNEFTEGEMNRLIDVLRRKIAKKSNAYDGIEFDRFHVLQTAYLEMCARPKVYNRVSYLLKILDGKEEATM